MNKMDKLKHTPGPWNYNGLSCIHAQGKLITAFPSQESQANPIEFAANGRLIAAAPEMLEGLILARKLMLKQGVSVDNADQYNLINNAINKATK